MCTLQRNGKVVRLGSPAFDILAVDASASGRLVTKDELMDAVWPNTIVEENTIQVHLSALRKIRWRNTVCPNRPAPMRWKSCGPMANHGRSSRALLPDPFVRRKARRT
ncbi:winged helix-turn-helix domain-containing protein [Paraburkholderia phytofirmans]